MPAVPSVLRREMIMRLLSATRAWVDSSLVAATAAALVLLVRARVVVLVYHDDRAVI